MPTTPLGFHYPSLTDQPNGPVQMQSLATDVDSFISPVVRYRIRNATVSVPSGSVVMIPSYGTTPPPYHDLGGGSLNSGVMTWADNGLAAWQLSVRWGQTSSDYKVAHALYVNGAPTPNGDNSEDRVVSAVGHADYTFSVGGEYPIVAGDQWDIRLAQSSGATRTPYVISVLFRLVARYPSS